MSELRLDGRVGIVTGAGRGIAKQFALMLAARGAKLLVNGNHRPDGKGPEQAVAKEIIDKGGEAISFNGSVANDEVCREMVHKAVETYGRLDMIVNAAGPSDGLHAIENGPEPILDQFFDIHIKGPMQLFRAAIPHLQASGSSRVLNFGSHAAFGFKGTQGWGGAYPIVKAGIFGLTRQMAGFGADHGIKVNLILPLAHTEAVEEIWDGTEFNRWWKENLPSRNVAATGLYLLHPECPVSGQFITVSGGRVSRVVFASHEGLFDAQLTPESVRDRWPEVMGRTNDDGRIEGMFEVSGQAVEYQLIQKIINEARTTG